MSECCIAKLAFTDEKEARDYVHQCEAAFAAQIDQLTSQMLAQKELRLLGLGGPSCAGKSTAAKHIIRNLQAAGKHVHMISIDDFFREQPKRTLLASESEKIDFDSIDALDFPLFCRCVDQLIHDGEAQMPVYDLSCGKRTGFRTYQIKDQNDVFLFEGIQTVYPEISDLLEKYPYFSTYINVNRSLRVGNTLFVPTRIRLLRRLVRDFYRRASTPDFTLLLWNGVRENEEKNIFPNADRCMAHLDSTMGYEIGMLRPYLETILPQILTSDAYGDIAADILDDIRAAQPISCELLPDVALYREFVGKTTLAD